MFAFVYKNRSLTKSILGAVLMLVFAGPLVLPLSVHAMGPGTPSYQPAPSQTQSVGATPQNSTKPLEFECWSIFPPKLDFRCLMAQIAWTVMVTFGQLMNLTSIGLNYSMQQLVVNMGGLVNSMPAVNVVWQTVRDIVNIFLVFLTIFVGIATILGVSGYGYKQFLWKILLAALLVNFSITLAKFVIDIGNLVTVATYTEILEVNHAFGGTLPASCTTPGAVSPDCLNVGLSGAFMQQMKLTTIYSGRPGDPAISGEKARVILFVAIFGIIFFLITAFIFAAAAFLILGRFAILLMLIMFSPVGLVLWITGVSSWGKKWWKMLLDQSFFLPIMFILWYATLKVMVEMNATLIGGQNLAAVLGAPGNSAIARDPMQFGGVMGVFVYFFIISFMMIASLVVSRSMGAYGASRAMGVGKMLGGLGLAYTVGAASSGVARRYERHMARAQQTDEEGNYINTSASARFARRMAGTKVDRVVQAGMNKGASTGFLGTKSLDQRRESSRTEGAQRREQLRGGATREASFQHIQTLTSGTATPEQIAYATEQIQKLSGRDLEDLYRRRNMRGQHTFDWNNQAFRNALTASQIAEIEKAGFTEHGRGAVRDPNDTSALSSVVGPRVRRAGTADMPSNATMRARRRSQQSEQRIARTAGHIGNLTSENRADRDEARQHLTSLTQAEIVTHVQRNRDTLLDDNAVRSFSSTQVAGMQTNLDLDPAFTTALVDRRHELLVEDVVNGGNDAGAARLARSMTDDEMRRAATTLNQRIAGGLPQDTLERIPRILAGSKITALDDGAVLNDAIASHLTSDQLAALDKAERLSPEDRQRMYDTIMGSGLPTTQRWLKENNQGKLWGGVRADDIAEREDRENVARQERNRREAEERRNRFRPRR